MYETDRARFYRWDWILAGGFAVVSSLLYFVGMAHFAYPGESAHLMVLWKGLETAETVQYPLMAGIAKALGGGNVLAPICGIVSTVGLFLLATFFVRLRAGGEHVERFAVPASRIAGVVTATMFMLTPAVRAAATHLEPRLFALAWAVLALLLFIPWYGSAGLMTRLWPVAMGILWGLGSSDQILITAIGPLVVVGCVAIPLRNHRRPYAELSLFLIASTVTFLLFSAFNGGVTDIVTTLWEQFKDYSTPLGWWLILFFATTSFIVSLFSSRKAFNEDSGWVQYIFHIALGVCSILMVATPLSPSELMAPAGVFPCAACAYVACVAGYLMAYWWVLAVAKRTVNESSGDESASFRQRILAYVAGSILVVVYTFMSFFNLFTVDSREGAFADRMAEKILDDLGDRTWFISDGSLDDHLMLVSARRGQELNLVSLRRDADRAYLERLGKIVVEKQVGGEKNRELALSLELGVLPFVQDWFSFDPASTKSVAIFGAPDLWYSAGVTPVPEFAFFGADPARTPDWTAWKTFDEILDAPKGWGSYRLSRAMLSPVARLKLELRRHLGFVCNNRGVWLQDQGRDDEAYEMYARVLDEIDSDNVCALFNLFEMANAKHPKASLKKHDYERRIKVIVDDHNRRYRLWSLANYYGYIRNPGIFIRLGYNWARSGRPGEALSQIRRAIDFIPTDRRASILNMMAALYASEDDRAKSRAVYQKVLERDANDHDALIGMMRLSLADGDQNQALEFLDRATKAAGDDPRIRVELAMAALMRGDLTKAKQILRVVTDADATDLRAWSLLAAVTIQQCDAAKDAQERRNFERELERDILPTMEKQSRDPHDYYVQTTRAFILLRQGAEQRKAARDAFEVAAKARPDVGATREIILGLDISLNDTEAAERHARETLRTDRKSPIANYVMGALALRKGNYDEAAQYLHKSADARKPVVLAMNDLAEVYRRKKDFARAEKYARLAIETAPELYVCYETLGTILVEKGGDLEEAKSHIQKAVELSSKNGKSEDVRMLISLARVQIKSGDHRLGRMTLRKVDDRKGELSDFEREEYEELCRSVSR